MNEIKMITKEELEGEMKLSRELAVKMLEIIEKPLSENRLGVIEKALSEDQLAAIGMSFSMGINVLCQQIEGDKEHKYVDNIIIAEEISYIVYQHLSENVMRQADLLNYEMYDSRTGKNK